MSVSVTTLHPSSWESTGFAFQSCCLRWFLRVSPSSERYRHPILYHSCQSPLPFNGVPELSVTMASQQPFYQGIGANIAAPSRTATIPHPREFFATDPQTSWPLYAKAPWFLPDTAHDKNFLEHYALGGEYPGNILVYALQSYDWQARCMVPSTAIFRRTGQNVEQARIGYIRAIYAHL